MKIKELIDSLDIKKGTIFCKDFQIAFTESNVSCYNYTLGKQFAVKDSLEIISKIIGIEGE